MAVRFLGPKRRKRAKRTSRIVTRIVPRESLTHLIEPIQNPSQASRGILKNPSKYALKSKHAQNRNARIKLTKKEGSHINKSLLALSNIIRKLSREVSNKNISYRNSKLTRIL
jgi:hypothetical protein